MAITFQDYTATASQTEFLFNFPYLEDEHVKVFVNGVEKTLTTDYTIQSSPAKKVILTTPATGGEVVRVRRISAPAVDLVDFVNGSVLTESELDRAYLHNRYLAEESSEQNDVSMRLTAGASGWDGLNKKILNIVDPVAEQDVATKNYVDGVVGNVALGVVPDDSITYTKIQDAVGNNVLLGNDNGAGEEIQELSATEVRSLLNVADGANTGTVVSIVSGTGLTGGPITTSGTLSLDSIGNLTALGNVSGSTAAPTAVEIKDEDAMGSNSATALATQQSIKAYVDARAVSKYNTGWVSQDDQGTPVSLGNGNELVFTHNLGSTEVSVQMYASDASQAIIYDPKVLISGANHYGAQVTGLTTNTVSVRLAKNGSAYLIASAMNTGITWGTGNAARIKLIITKQDD
jgi:hypothetical protein